MEMEARWPGRREPPFLEVVGDIISEEVAFG